MNPKLDNQTVEARLREYNLINVEPYINARMPLRCKCLTCDDIDPYYFYSLHRCKHLGRCVNCNNKPIYRQKTCKCKPSMSKLREYLKQNNSDMFVLPYAEPTTWHTPLPVLCQCCNKEIKMSFKKLSQLPKCQVTSHPVTI